MIRIPIPLPSRNRLEEDYNARIEVLERALFEVHRRIKVLLSKTGLHPTVKYRVKSFESYYQKILRRVSNPEEMGNSLVITDLIGIRIVCPFIADLPLVENLLSKEFSIAEREKKGAEFSFKEFGYESVHYLMHLPQDVYESFSLPESLVCEVQLRTILQDAWAEVEHELVYKSDYTPFDESLRRKLAALNANLSLADMIFHEIREYQRELQRQLRRRRADFWDLVNRSEDAHLDRFMYGGETTFELRSSLPANGSTGANGAAKNHGPSGNGKEFEATVEQPARDTVPDAAMPAVVPSYDVIDGQLLKALYAHNDHHYEEAVELYTAILEMEPRPAVRTIVLVHRGMVYFALGKYTEAIEDFGLSIEGEGDHRKAYYYRAVAYRQSGDYAFALDDLNRCLNIDMYQPEALLSRAQTQIKLGDYAAALQDVDMALSLNPDDEEAKRFREVINAKLGV